MGPYKCTELGIRLNLLHFVVSGLTRLFSLIQKDMLLSQSATWSMQMSASGKQAPMNSNCTRNNFAFECIVIKAMREQAVKLQ